jgi:hypothetical protein
VKKRLTSLVMTIAASVRTPRESSYREANAATLAAAMG